MAASKVAIPPLPKRLFLQKNSSQQSSEGDSSPSPGADVRKPKRTRTSAPRVRTGCTTCKIRHVKCDETKPSCTNCSSTGRKCDGYTNAASRQSAPESALPKRFSGSTVASLFENRAFDHFCHYNAPILSSFFDDSLWMRLVLQMSSASPAVRHAVVALETLTERMSAKASLQRSSYRSLKQHNEDWRNDSFAIAQYNKAIEHLTKDKESTTSTDIIMLVCVLFICIESLRGDIGSAFMHFNGGMKTAMAQSLSSRLRPSGEPVNQMEPDVLTCLCRIELLSSLFGNEPSWAYPFDLQEILPHDFIDLKAARDSLIHIMNIILRFLRQISKRRHGRSITIEDYGRQSELKQALDDWERRLDSTTSRFPVKHSHTATQMLRMHYFIAYIMLIRCTDASERPADKLLPEFEQAIGLAEDLVANLETRSSTRAGTFMLDMEIVSPTYFIAVKCRHPQVRRRAITLLRKMHRREGFFDSDLAAVLATRVVAIEEAHLTVFDGSEWPGEESRVHHTDIKAAFEVDGLRYTSKFYKKPNGVDWEVLEEEIDPR